MLIYSWLKMSWMSMLKDCKACFSPSIHHIFSVSQDVK